MPSSFHNANTSVRMLQMRGENILRAAMPVCRLAGRTQREFPSTVMHWFLLDFRSLWFFACGSLAQLTNASIFLYYYVVYHRPRWL
ncbi:unnamed protein product [Rhizoctonia solani]|uniref:Uncharacterized protein n=1 Tax=Rhizoctonia solani TaxID=456999 RepID=A0A8H3AK85_9AGAM|nr:unnamed protein product [Rhizoctonia solani]